MNAHAKGAPTFVRVGVWLLSTAIAVQLAMSSVVSMAFLSVVSLAGSLISAGLAVFFVYKIWRGRNWARITYLVVFVLVAVIARGSVVQIPQLLESAPLLGIGDIAVWLFQITGIVVLFIPSSNDWFRGQGNAPTVKQDQILAAGSDQRSGHDAG